MIKTLKTIISIITVAMVMASCNDEQAAVVEYLDVTSNNISGSWELVEWNGSALQSGTYVFLELMRKDNTFSIYQNLDSFENIPHSVTGRFYLNTDPEIGTSIRGIYDFDSGDWAHSYIILDLTKDSMKWVAKDNPAYIQIYKRIESIPVKE